MDVSSATSGARRSRWGDAPAATPFVPPTSAVPDPCIVQLKIRLQTLDGSKDSVKATADAVLRLVATPLPSFTTEVARAFLENITPSSGTLTMVYTLYVLNDILLQLQAKLTISPQLSRDDLLSFLLSSLLPQALAALKVQLLARNEHTHLESMRKLVGFWRSKGIVDDDWVARNPMTVSPPTAPTVVPSNGMQLDGDNIPTEVDLEKVSVGMMASVLKARTFPPYTPLPAPVLLASLLPTSVFSPPTPTADEQARIKARVDALATKWEKVFGNTTPST